MKVEKSRLLEAKKPILKSLLDKLLDSYPYASILAVDSKGKSYSMSKTGTNISEIEFLCEVGYVVKVYDENSYGEYSFNQIDENDIDEIVAKIKEHLVPWKGKLPEALSIKQYPQMPDEAHQFVESTEYEIHPEEMGDGKIIERLSELRDTVLAKNEKLLDCAVMSNLQVYHKLFLSPNKEMEQNIMWTVAAMSVMGLRGEEVKDTFKAVSGRCGMEIIDQLEAKVPEALETLENLLKSEPMIPGEYDCICAPDVTGMIVHEAFGHGVEMDMFVKKRALAEKYVGEYVASPLVTMHDGAAVAEETASFFFDDEGTMAQDTIVIDKGILKRGICDAQAGMALKSAPTGNGRRESTQRKAYTRMTNTYFEAGTDKLEDMIASIEYGFFLENASSGMEDPKNWGIQCMVNVAREIKDGKFTGKVFSPIVLTGYVPDLLKSITMMSEEVELGGAGMCGKGYKEWVKVSDGGPYIKAKIRLG